MPADFNSLLQVNADDVKAPPRPPQGTWKALITKYEFGKSQKKNTPFVKFHFTGFEPQADIPQDQLLGVELHKLKLSDDFYLTEDAMYRLVGFLKDCVGVPSGGRKVSEMIPDAVNQPIMFYVTQSPSNKPGSNEVYSNITAYLNPKGQLPGGGVSV